MVLPNYKQWADSLYFVVQNADEKIAKAEITYALHDAENRGRTMHTIQEHEALRLKQVKEWL